MATWRATIAVYGAGEAINGSGALAPEIRRQLERLARTVTNRQVAATAQLDAGGAPALRYVLDPRGQLPVEQLPNVNTGDPAALLDFVAWSTAKCPAQHLVLVLSGHGVAWQDSEADAVLGPGTTRAPGAPPRRPGCFHHPRAVFGRGLSKTEMMRRAVLLDGHDRDYLSNSELGAVCLRIGQARSAPIDVLVLDACLMSSVELLHELRGSVATVVAAVDELSAAGIDMAQSAAWMSATDALTATAVAGRIAASFKPLAAFDSCVAIDLGGDAWGQAIGHFRALSAGLAAWVAQARDRAALVTAALRLAATSVVQYNRGGLADVRALVSALSSLNGVPPATLEAGQRAQAAFRAAVIQSSMGADYRDAGGLSVFAPGSATVFMANRAEYVRLQFAVLTGWGAFLDLVFGIDSDGARLVTRSAAGWSQPFDVGPTVAVEAAASPQWGPGRVPSRGVSPQPGQS